jgi:hypothetical protein
MYILICCQLSDFILEIKLYTYVGFSVQLEYYNLQSNNLPRYSVVGNNIRESLVAHYTYIHLHILSSPTRVT